MNCLLMGKEKIVHTQRVVMFTDVSKVTRKLSGYKMVTHWVLGSCTSAEDHNIQKKYLLNANFAY